MTHLNYFIAFEICAFVSFIAIIGREIFQKKYLRVFEIISCAIFGLLLEIGDTYLAHTYSYGEKFFFMLFGVPIAIGLGWAVIIYSAMLLSDQYNVPWYFRPFIDSLTAIILDLAIDAVAIRLGFWHWIIPMNEEWYGVPFDNLLGWILVVLSFSFIIRFIRTLNYKRILTKVIMIFSPLLAYMGLTIGILIFSVITTLPFALNNWQMLIGFNYVPDFSVLYNSHVQLWKTIVLTAVLVELVNITVWVLVKYRKNFTKHFDLLTFTAISTIHLFFIFAIFETNLYKEMPILLVICILMFSIHLLLHFLPYIRQPKIIYLFKKIEQQIKKDEKLVQRAVEQRLQ